MFKNKKEIESRIMSVIRSKITEKQAEYDNGVMEITERTMAKVDQIVDESRIEKNSLADKCVNDIIGKLL